MFEIAVWLSGLAALACVVLLYLGTDRRRSRDSPFFRACPGCAREVRIGLGECPACGVGLLPSDALLRAEDEGAGNGPVRPSTPIPP
jgi:hypothetical protein